ncbi:AAA family ATPase [Mesorhizobium sophorae]|uniref:AAA family ATPase n=1 Tax=Mesorhizobium sophorae TaxID=1300294 RepID=UPI00142E62D3|nr:AAA family ATPase [Mesorhizobium sophorae]
MNSTPAIVKILTSKQFVAGWKPPNFLVDGIFQKGFIYSLTAKAGSGKTAIALTLAALVALGRPLGERTVERGKVLYFAGENPDDIRTRWLLLAEKMDFDPTAIEVNFIPTAFPMEQVIDQVKKGAKDKGPYALVIIDTSAAYYSGQDDNANVEMQHHAETLRSLTDLAGEPCVIICAHPAKGGDIQVPRGGSAFLNAIDGNVYLEKKDKVAWLKQHQKFRGPEFSPITFELVSVMSSQRRDAQRRPIRSVMAVAVAGNEVHERSSSLDLMALRALQEKPGRSVSDLAKAVGLQPDGSGRGKMNRLLQRLEARQLARRGDDGHWRLAKEGAKALRLQ